MAVRHDSGGQRDPSAGATALGSADIRWGSDGYTGVHRPGQSRPLNAHEKWRLIAIFISLALITLLALAIAVKGG